MIYTIPCESPFGTLWIFAHENAITEIHFPNALPAPDHILEATPLLLQAKQQLSEYWKRKRTTFTLPLDPKGTPYQKKVWNALLTIPFGETRSYGEIAKQLGNPKAARAVGFANHNNPIPILIPCHRVIGANGSLTGYAGGLEIKKALLMLEQTTASL